MLKSLKNVAIFNNLSQEIAKPSHAYLFYGEDKMLNVELAKLFVASIFCGKPACLQCEVCKRTDINKNPDLLIIDKPSLQVADISGLIENVQLKPMIYDYKIIFIVLQILSSGHTLGYTFSHQKKNRNISSYLD